MPRGQCCLLWCVAVSTVARVDYVGSTHKLKVGIIRLHASVFITRLNVIWISNKHTNTHPFNGPFPGLPRCAGTRKVPGLMPFLPPNQQRQSTKYQTNVHSNLAASRQLCSSNSIGSLSIILTVIDQKSLKIWKSWHFPPSHHPTVKATLSNITFLMIFVLSLLCC